MSKIEKAFENKKAFIPFVTAGDPTLDVTEQLLYEMQKAGADLIEIGIPFSDPTAEGPVIQEANERALAEGCTTCKRKNYGSNGIFNLCQSDFHLWKRTFYETMCGKWN